MAESQIIQFWGAHRRALIAGSVIVAALFCLTMAVLAVIGVVLFGVAMGTDRLSLTIPAFVLLGVMVAGLSLAAVVVLGLCSFSLWVKQPPPKE